MLLFNTTSLNNSVTNNLVQHLYGGDFIMDTVRLMVFGDSILGAASTNFTDSGTSYGITGITNANPCVVSETNSNLSATAGDILYIHSVQGMTNINDAEYTATAGTVASATLNLNSSAFGTYTQFGKIYKRNGAIVYEYPQGVMGYLNAIGGQRFRFYHDYNRGISGRSLAEMNQCKTQCLSSIAFDAVVVMGGTNSVGTNSGATPASLASMISDTTEIVNYITNTLGKVVVLGVCPPCDDQTATQIQRRKDYNNWVRTQASGMVIVWDYYNDVTNVSDDWNTNYSYDGTHPAGEGGWYMAKSLYNAMASRYGRYGYSLNAGNLVVNPTLTGTGGSISGTAITNSGIAASWTAESSGGSSALTRTVSKDASDVQTLTCNFGSGLSNAERLAVRQSITTGLVDNTYYVAEALIQITAASGTWYEASLELRNQSSAQAACLPRRAVSDTLPHADIMATNSGLLHLKTQPVMKLSTWTELRPRISMLFNNVSETGSGTMKVVGCQVYPVASARG